jgi:hypothetical protein
MPAECHLSVASLVQTTGSRPDVFTTTLTACGNRSIVFPSAMPQSVLSPGQRLREHLEDALAEADAMGQPLVAALISTALEALNAAPNDTVGP